MEYVFCFLFFVFFWEERKITAHLYGKENVPVKRKRDEIDGELSYQFSQ